MEQELAIRLEDDRIHYQTLIEIPVMTKDEKLRVLLRKRGRVPELSYHSYSNKRRDQLYLEILANLGLR